MKICHIAATSEGATWMFQQLRELRERHGHEVSAIISGDNGSLATKLRAENIPFYVWDFEFASSKDLFGLPRKIIRLARLLRRENYDVVHTHLFNSMVIGRLAGWLAGIRVRVSMIAGPYHLEAYTPRWIDFSTCWLDSKIIASCDYTRQLYRRMGVKEKHIELIYYGPDANEFNPSRFEPAQLKEEYGLDDGALLIIMVAYFYPRVSPSNWSPPQLWERAIKGHEYLIRAMPMVLDKHPNARCFFVGCGWGVAGTDYQNQMKSLVASLQLEDKVIFTGYRADANNILNAASVAVQPSINENLGGTIESLLMMRPTVASRVGGMTDSVIDSHTGLLVNPGDEVDLASAIITLLSNREYAKSLGENGRERMLKGFTLQTTVKRLDSLYSQLLRQSLPTKKSVLLGRCLIAPALAFYLALRLILIDTLLLSKLKALQQTAKACAGKGFLECLRDFPKHCISVAAKLWSRLKLIPYIIYGKLRKLLAFMGLLRWWDNLLFGLRRLIRKQNNK